MSLCSATAAEGHEGARPCTFRASRPSGMCGTHDRAARLRAERAEATRRRGEFARSALGRTGPMARALTGLGFDSTPRLAGVLLSTEAAERLLARLSTPTEGAAQ